MKHCHKHKITQEIIPDYETQCTKMSQFDVNPLNAELNPIRHLLTLVGARHIVHVSRIRVNGVWCITFTAVSAVTRRKMTNGKVIGFGQSELVAAGSLLNRRPSTADRASNTDPATSTLKLNARICNEYQPEGVQFKSTQLGVHS